MHTKIDQFELLDPIVLSQVAGGAGEPNYCSQPGKLAFMRNLPLYHGHGEIVPDSMRIVQVNTCLTHSSASSR